MKYALLIGNTEYTDPKLAQLRAPAADVTALAEVLQAPDIGGFNVKALLNRPFAEVQPAIEDIFAAAQTDDLVLLYFSGHGVQDERGQLYLALAETRFQRPRALSIPGSFLKEVMDCAHARQQVLILDCCYSGAFAAGLKGAPGAQALTEATFGDETRSRGRVVLTATDTTEYAWEGNKVLGEIAENSLYTHYLIEALRTGAADEDGDGWITPNDLHAYISRQIAPRQHPRLFALAQEGAIRLAHNPHPPAPRPASLPPELQQAVASPFAGIRKGAVEELARLLLGPDYALALTAGQALQRLADDDSRSVSEAAERALQEADSSSNEFVVQARKSAEAKRAQLEAQLAALKASRPPVGPEATTPATKSEILQQRGKLISEEPRGRSTTTIEANKKPAAAEDERRKPELLLKLSADVVLEMVRVPAGEFLMGSNKAKDKEADADEAPQHKLYLPEYLIGKYPVTVAQFAAFVKAAGHQTTAEKEGSGDAWTGSEWQDIKGANWQHPRGPQSDVKQKTSHPVTLVSRDDAMAFCAWASQATGQTVRLPFEPEWEKAARGPSTSSGESRIWPWGDEPPDEKRCNFDMKVGDTTPVGKYSPLGDSPYGCADMAGNVWEWTGSIFKPYPYKAEDGREDAKSRETRVLRGGSFDYDRRYIRCASRSGGSPRHLYDNYGFRVCARPAV